MLYDVVRCSGADAETRRNLWDCAEVRPAVSGRCDPVTNAAGVTCEPLPAPTDPVATAAVLREVTCNATAVTSCFQSTTNDVLTPQHFAIQPRCSFARKLLVNNTVCCIIPLRHCQHLPTAVNETFSSYCYDVVYSSYSSDAHLLMTASMTEVTSRVCCVIAKTGRAVADFAVMHEPPDPSVHSSSHNLTFSLHCFHDETFNGEPVNGQTVTRGKHVYCMTRVNVWDERQLLVVDNCYFSPHRRPSNATYYFIDNRCPTTDVLDLLFYSSQQLSWGVRFAVPKYQAFDSLYVACSAYICDSAAESSEHCDRSCVGLEPTATRRSQTGGRSRRSRGASTQQLHMQTHFTVADEGFGPLIDNYGQLRLIDHTQLQVDQSSAANSSAFKAVIYSVTTVILNVALIYFL